jgi:methionyl-tRNA synthetase
MSAKTPFYITTAIDYANGRPHLGHAYEKVLTDVVARFRRLRGDDVHFLTGLDEHGQKVQRSSREQGVDPKVYVDGIAEHFHALLKDLNISNDDFIRTTEERHKSVVRELLQRLMDKGDIYQASYKGFYSVRQEQFLQEKERGPDGKWPELFGDVVEITETNYFFRLAKYQEWLIAHIKANEDFIFPRFRAKQVLEFLREPLNDLCISRPKERLAWGIPLPFDENYVTYVWFDALVNYASAIWKDGAPDPKWWNVVTHTIGKDILVPPHAVYWPVMLHACGIPPPKHLLVHGWWLAPSGKKISKSDGTTTVVTPLDLAKQFGADAFRYFLMREMNVGQDSEFTEELFFVRYNSDLANDLGNLVNRVHNMASRYCGGVIPDVKPEGDLESEIPARWATVLDESLRLCEDYQFHAALERALGFVKSVNQYLERRAPWKLAKSPDPADQERVRMCVAVAAEALRAAVTLCEPVMPGVTPRVYSALGYASAGSWEERLRWGTGLAGCRLGEAVILFPKPERK